MRFSWKSLVALPILPKRTARNGASRALTGVPVAADVPDVTRFSARFEPRADGELALDTDPRGRYMLYDDYRDVVVALQNEGLDGGPETLIQARTRLLAWGLVVLILLATGIYAAFHGFRPYLLGAAAGIALVMILNPERRHA